MLKRFTREGYTLCIDTVSGQKWHEFTADQINPEPTAEPPKGPGKIRRIGNFAKAAAKHVAAGQPKATIEQIEERFAICQNCPANLYQVLADEQRPSSLAEASEVGTCLDKSCGCYLHASELSPNKLGWADQRCPLGHWQPIVPAKRKGCCGGT